MSVISPGISVRTLYPKGATFSTNAFCECPELAPGFSILATSASYTFSPVRSVRAMRPARVNHQIMEWRRKLRRGLALALTRLFGYTCWRSWFVKRKNTSVFDGMTANTIAYENIP